MTSQQKTQLYSRSKENHRLTVGYTYFEEPDRLKQQINIWKRWPANVDIFLVPGVGFVKKGTRLGKGSGIYDKLLSNHLNSTFIGVTDKNHLVDHIPFENHDIQMHGLIMHDDFIDIMNNIHTVEPSKSLNVTLRPYQQDALSWMTDREVIKSPTYEMQNPSFNQSL